jgi:hypothetical protein
VSVYLGRGWLWLRIGRRGRPRLSVGPCWLRLHKGGGGGDGTSTGAGPSHVLPAAAAQAAAVMRASCAAGTLRGLTAPAAP